jgi:hypothetical protein
MGGYIYITAYECKLCIPNASGLPMSWGEEATYGGDRGHRGAYNIISRGIQEALKKGGNGCRLIGYLGVSVSIRGVVVVRGKRSESSTWPYCSISSLMSLLFCTLQHTHTHSNIFVQLVIVSRVSRLWLSLSSRLSYVEVFCCLH